MQRGFCDSHAHLTSSNIVKDVDAVLMRAQSAGIDYIVNICMDTESLEKGLELVQKYPWVYNAAAVHPHDAEKEGPVFFPFVVAAARQNKLVAIGETGLDYHYNHSPKEVQKQSLENHLQLALEVKLPVIIHCREAYPDFFEIIDREYKQGPGVLHCFTGTYAEAQQGLDRGFYVSMSGIMTFKKSVELREVAKMVPLDRLLIETDAPYLAPQSKRGLPNEPAYVIETGAIIADIKGISLAALVEHTTHNAKVLFGIS